MPYEKQPPTEPYDWAKGADWGRPPVGPDPATWAYRIVVVALLSVIIAGLLLIASQKEYEPSGCGLQRVAYSNDAYALGDPGPC